jgi:hypothetical protein
MTYTKFKSIMEDLDDRWLDHEAAHEAIIMYEEYPNYAERYENEKEKK